MINSSGLTGTLVAGQERQGGRADRGNIGKRMEPRKEESTGVNMDARHVEGEKGGGGGGVRR